MNQLEDITKQESAFITDLKQIVHTARRVAYAAINFAQVEENWLIGQRIVIQEQNGKQRAEYGKHIIELASKELTVEFGKGFSERNLWKFKQFYLLFRDFQILPTLSAELSTPKVLTQNSKENMPTLSAESSQQIWRTRFAKLLHSLPKLTWSHYERLMRVADTKARNWYMQEAETEMWAYRTLDRNINTQYFERKRLFKKTFETASCLC